MLCKPLKKQYGKMQDNQLIRLGNWDLAHLNQLIQHPVA
jgi:hypothetical protein